MALGCWLQKCDSLYGNSLSPILWFIHFYEPIWRRHWHPTPVLLPEKSHGRRSLVVCSPWGCKESDRTEPLHFHFSLSCIGEGHGNPLQCSCLENPRDGGAWWAAFYGVSLSRTWLKRLRLSNEPIYFIKKFLKCIFFFEGAGLRGLWDFSSSTTDKILDPGSESAKP